MGDRDRLERLIGIAGMLTYVPAARPTIWLAGLEHLPCDRIYLAADPCTPPSPIPRSGPPSPGTAKGRGFSLRNSPRSYRARMVSARC
jgi:hypothetical protein